MTTREKSDKYFAPTYKKNLTITGGNGAYLYGDDGKRYLDFGSGIAVNTVGAANKAWAEAVAAQSLKIAHTSNLYDHVPGAELAEKLCGMTGFSRVFFSNSGAEANECAIKCARKYSFDRYGIGRSNIVTLKNSFHGRTMATLSATGQEKHHQYFMPFVEGFAYAKPDDFDDFLKVAGGSTCAVMIELIQGESGVNALSKDFVRSVAGYAAKHDILLIIDEVQTGNGRTGTLYLYEQYGIKPDIVTTAKGLAGGLPLGATLFNEKTAEVFTPGTHGSTFGGNPVACAGALVILNTLTMPFLREVAEKGQYLKEKLHGIEGVTSVSGAGLMLGAAVKNAAEIAAACVEQGLLILTAGEKLRFLPSLTITYSEIDEGIEILKRVAMSSGEVKE